MLHAADANELLEVARNELRAIVGDGTWKIPRTAFPTSLQNRLDVSLGHRLADLPMNKRAAVATEYAAQAVEAARNIQVADANIPVLVCCGWLVEACALLGGLTAPNSSVRQPASVCNRPLRGWRRRCHHVRAPPIAVVRMSYDRLALPVLSFWWPLRFF